MAYGSGTRQLNGPTEAINGQVEHMRGSALCRVGIADRAAVGTTRPCSRPGGTPDFAAVRAAPDFAAERSSPEPGVYDTPPTVPNRLHLLWWPAEGDPLRLAACPGELGCALLLAAGAALQACQRRSSSTPRSRSAKVQ